MAEDDFMGLRDYIEHKILGFPYEDELADLSLIRRIVENNRNSSSVPYNRIKGRRLIVQDVDGKMCVSDSTIIHVWDLGANSREIQKHIELELTNVGELEQERKMIREYFAGKPSSVEPTTVHTNNAHSDVKVLKIDWEMDSVVKEKQLVKAHKNLKNKHASTSYVLYSIDECEKTSDPISQEEISKNIPGTAKRYDETSYID